MTAEERLTGKRFQESGGVDDWRVLAFGASAWFDTDSHTAGAELVRRIADLAGGADRMPDVDLRPRGVHVRIRPSPDFTEAHVVLARAISAAARELGLAADPSAVQAVQLAFDALDRTSVMPFWRAVLGYDQADEDLLDGSRRDPAIWFQQQDRPRPLRNRIHLDVARPHLPIAEWVAAVESAGGHQVKAGEHHGLLADADGNEVDVVPADDLDGGSETADWRVVFGAMAFYPVTVPARAAELAATVASLADDAGLPLLVDLRPDGVTIDSGKDQWEGEPRFVELARRVQAAARGMGLTADPTRLRFVQIGIDAVDVPTARGFWRAVLGYEYDSRPFVTDIYDPRRLGLPIIFQQMSASETKRRAQRNRIHVDVFVPDDQARARIDAALAAGGRIVYDDEAPEWWTLADPEGNELDIAVSVGREELWLAARESED